MTAKTCPDCGEEVTYNSCQQPNTDAVADLALFFHRKVAHGDVSSLEPDLMGKAFVQIIETRESATGHNATNTGDE